MKTEQMIMANVRDTHLLLSAINPECKTRLANLCKELSEILGLTQGSVEIHCYHGKPQQVYVHDKSIKFDDETKLVPAVRR